MPHPNVHNTPSFHPKQLVTTTTYDHIQGRTILPTIFDQYHQQPTNQTLAITQTYQPAIALIKPDSVVNHHVDLTIYATCATNPGTLDSAASLKPILHSFLKPANSLPLTVTTPIKIKKFAAALRTHPDQNLVSYLIHGLTHGFSIGYSIPHTATRPKNLLSATQHPDDVSAALSKELARGHTSGPFLTPPWPDIHCSPLGSRPKKDGSRRLIMDLSQPCGASINEGICKEDFSVQYTHFDAATDLVFKKGRNCLMSKLDIKHAFRLLPVLPCQWILLGIFWLGYYFVDTRLPFGLRSSPAIFNRFADAICWIIQHIYNIINLIHYSDDFFLVSPPFKKTALHEITTVKSAFQYLGVPLAEDKLEGPTTSITYLGIQIDSTEFTISIPNEKFHELMELLPSWYNRQKCTKKELLSLIGKLSFVCKVVRPGRIFLRRLITLSTTVKQLHHHICLNKNSRADIQWWIDFLPSWNKKSIIPETLFVTSNDIKLFTDASSIGFGAIYGTSWIQGQWDTKHQDMSIDYKELFAIVAAVLTWGSGWQGKRVIFITDNKPITEIWHSGTTSSIHLMSLVRKLFLIAARLEFSVSFKHIYGVNNPVADALSRFQMSKFHHLVPDADQQPTRLPPAIWDM